MFSRRLKVRIGSTAAVAIAAFALGTTSASAGLIVPAALDCDEQSISQPFTPWLDLANYTALAGADFESSAAGWALTGGAQVAPGNESFHVSGPGQYSLALPANSTATSPTICVGIEHPTLRFFAKRNSGGFLGLSTLRVDVLFDNQLGHISSLPIGVVTASGSWQPTLPMTVIANLLPLLSGEHTPVQFRFTPMLGGSWSIDDVHVDPYARK